MPLEVLSSHGGPSLFVSISPHGTSQWNYTYQVEAKDNLGLPRSYFLKVVVGPCAEDMVRGEYESAKSLHTWIPQHTPHPLFTGVWDPEQKEFFILFEFVEMLPTGLEHLKLLADVLAELHETSECPDVRFGFPVPTYHGTLRQDNFWVDTWQAFYTHALLCSFRKDQSINGPSEEIAALQKDLFEFVIPRLLGALETRDQKLKVSLIHGDLWSGNMALDSKTRHVTIFDACSFWGHNEYDLAEWGPSRSNLDPCIVERYHTHIPRSAPQDEYDDRIRLYSLRFNLHDSALFPSRPIYRQRIKEVMRYLVQKYVCAALNRFRYEGQ
ncbi:Fructosamine kinase-domain-containing protein [Hypoxylon sp. NC1633]|nr:Fructosamine kinase-domain-containing protein [Hypoxylon sp. NC1633]